MSAQPEQEQASLPKGRLGQALPQEIFPALQVPVLAQSALALLPWGRPGQVLPQLELGQRELSQLGAL